MAGMTAMAKNATVSLQEWHLCMLYCVTLVTCGRERAYRTKAPWGMCYAPELLVLTWTHKIMENPLKLQLPGLAFSITNAVSHPKNAWLLFERFLSVFLLSTIALVCHLPDCFGIIRRTLFPSFPWENWSPTAVKKSSLAEIALAWNLAPSPGFKASHLPGADFLICETWSHLQLMSHLESVRCPRTGVMTMMRMSTSVCVLCHLWLDNLAKSLSHPVLLKRIIPHGSVLSKVSWWLQNAQNII